MATLRRDSRPTWVPTKRQVLVHVNQCVMLWYLCIILMTFGIKVDSYQDGQVTASDVGGLLVALAVFVVWLCGAYLLRQWAAKPRSPGARLNDWRQTLTALANGFESHPSPAATFTSIMTAGTSGIREYPRFVAPGVEFGTLSSHSRRSGEWHYVAVTLPAPLPHLILDATSTGRLSSNLPVGLVRDQKLSLEGNFDQSFQVYSPLDYRMEALYVLTPDLMAALIDDAAGYNVEIIDHTLVFFTPRPADFSTSEPWNSVHALLTNVAPRIIAKARRYLDERVPGQEIPRVLAKLTAERERPEITWIAPPPLIGPEGRLTIRDRRTGVWSAVFGIGWFVGLTFLYAVPGLFAFAGFMSIIDGR
ncbi:hypothetical protein [Glaciibacter psychrotolerans]|uniref:DUF3137 domain-containing protein n=1 Tax=Glaciibacter psychrotolerans TaxID=670054 RepID=A0A7Z0J6V9_9MICO|nr:hypothetical protein [Leifsonia psychrotolerans]NYJ20825.1 hypothetical protein [Leifsonia psychrotolerans]